MHNGQAGKLLREQQQARIEQRDGIGTCIKEDVLWGQPGSFEGAAGLSGHNGFLRLGRARLNCKASWT